ncbi:UNVERIFIED_CONTAM: hypothetical protein PYX00_001248 [Menopon gallinae]|uniref:Uncharacterized protein n=1 Tax=Menopon gallinae TaxID=328185 RepID=A0AAW2IC57_9NEOP
MTETLDLNSGGVLVRKADSFVMPVQESSQTAGTRSVFGRWLKDLRPANREPKVHHPLGRTLSANVKDKDRKKKISRSLSASQKDRKKDYRELYVNRDESCNAEKCPEKRKCNKREESGEQWRKEKNQENFRGMYRQDEVVDGGLAINRSALVSYLDEEGLNGVESRRRGSEDNPEVKR